MPCIHVYKNSHIQEFINSNPCQLVQKLFSIKYRTSQIWIRLQYFYWFTCWTCTCSFMYQYYKNNIFNDTVITWIHINFIVFSNIALNSFNQMFPSFLKMNAFTISRPDSHKIQFENRLGLVNKCRKNETWKRSNSKDNAFLIKI